MISYLTLISENIWIDTADYCEAGRFSAFVSEELILYPCSFYNDVSTAGVDLRTNSIQYGWKHGPEFLDIREKLMQPSKQDYPIALCGECAHFAICHGGCPKFDINMCGGNYI